MLRRLPATTAALLVVCGPAWAIPTPDAVVGAAYGLAQIGGFAAVLAGGAIAKLRLRPARASDTTVLVLCLLLGLSFGGNLLLASWLDTEPSAVVALAGPEADAERRAYPDMDWDEAEQGADPAGMDPTEFAATLAARPAGTLLLDVRERGEVEQSGIDGLVPVRAPDLPASGLDLIGKRVIVTCFSGMRGSEVCRQLARLGVDCRFLRGGMKRWIAERRPLRLSPGTDDSRIGTILDYPNQTTYLSAGDVRALRDQGATLVDGRRASVAAADPIPGATVIPATDLPLPDLQARLRALPLTPVIGVCAGPVACAMADIIGSEASRAGLDFRGIHMLPPRPGAAPATPSLWSRAIGRSAEALLPLAHRVGLGPAVLLAVLLVRLLCWPIDRAAERNRAAMAAAAPAIRDAKRRLTGDPERLARAIRALHRRHGVRPAAALAALATLPALGFCAAVAGRAAEWLRLPIAWMADPAAPDPSGLLPAATAAVFATVLALALPLRPVRRGAVALGAALPLYALGASMSGAACLALAAGGALLLAQRFAHARPVAWLRAATIRRHARRTGIVALADAPAVLGATSKASRLGALAAAGMPVPPGFVVLNPDRDSAAMRRAWRSAGIIRAAVRSSAVAEDGAAASQAGQFHTELGVGLDGADAAERAVWTSYRKRGAAAAGDHVLVQSMVDARLAGVLFTRHPGRGGALAIECVDGLGDCLVSGAATPQSFAFGRASGRQIDGPEPPVDFAPLIALARRVESLAGGPQDIEWAWDGARFLLLQTRPITSALAAPSAEGAPGRIAEAERDRLSLLLAETGGPLAEDAMAEILPTPTPMSLALLNALWAPGGSVDLACRRLGLLRLGDEMGPPAYDTAFGRLVVRPDGPTLAPVGRLAARAVVRRAAAIERAWLETELPALRTRMSLLGAVDPARLDDAALHRLFQDEWSHFTGPGHAAAQTLNLAASVLLERASARLRALGLEPAAHLGAPPDTALRRAWDAAARERDPDARTAALLRECGHRAEADYELAAPRCAETGRPLAALPPRRTGSPPPAAAAAMVTLALRFQTLKEDSKHEVLRAVALLRALLLEIDRRAGLDGGVFHLHPDEIPAPGADTAAARALIAARRRTGAVLAAMPPLPAVIDAACVETHGASGAPELPRGGLRGHFVSGAGPLSGTVLALGPHTAPPQNAVGPDTVVVLRCLPPDAVAGLAGARAVITEIGGWLSHSAILAREAGLPLVVGAHGATALPTGTAVGILVDGSIVAAPVSPPHTSAA